MRKIFTSWHVGIIIATNKIRKAPMEDIINLLKVLSLYPSANCMVRPIGCKIKNF